MLTLGLLMLAAGFALFGAALASVLRANAGRRVPYSRRPDVAPAGSTVSRAVGAGLIVAGTVLCGTQSSMWWVALPVALLALVALTIRLHNVRVAAPDARRTS